MRHIIFVLLLVVAVTSCASGSGGDNLDVNNSITVTAPLQVNSFYVNDFIGLLVQNNTKDNIKMSAEYGIHVLEKNQAEWLDVVVINPYISPTTIAPQSDKELDFAYLNFLFEYDVQVDTTFRFMVKGVNQRTDKEVYAFVDLILSPCYIKFNC